MGVPAFFRWLSRKYPSVIVECIEDRVSFYNFIFLNKFNFIIFSQQKSMV